MKRELHLLAHLYDEPDADAPPLRDLLEDPELAREHRELSAVRFALDHGPRERPSPGVVDAIVRNAPRPDAAFREAEARRRPGLSTPWLDRPALRRAGSIRRRSLIPAFAIAAAVALTVMIAPWSLVGPSSQETVMADAQAPVSELAPPESLLRALPPAAAVGLMSQSDPEWDTGEDLRQLHRRIRSLQAAGVTEWDEPAVPLEMLPSSVGEAGFQAAGSRRNP